MSERVLVFDMDGVLVDPSESFRRTTVEVVKRFTGHETTFERIIEINSMQHTQSRKQATPPKQRSVFRRHLAFAACWEICRCRESRQVLGGDSSFPGDASGVIISVAPTCRLCDKMQENAPVTQARRRQRREREGQ